MEVVGYVVTAINLLACAAHFWLFVTAGGQPRNLFYALLTAGLSALAFRAARKWRNS